MTQAPEITPRSWAMVGALGLVWGATFLFIEVALRGIGPFWLAAYRNIFAALMTVAIWRWRGGQLFLSETRNWPSLLMVGVLTTGLPYMLLSWGQQFASSGFAGVSMASVALMVLPLAHFLVPGERMSLRRGIGFLLGFSGVVVLIGPDALLPAESDMARLGRMACLGAAVCYAISSVAMRRLPPIDPIGLSAVPLLAGCAFVVPLALALEGPPPLPDGFTLAVVALLGLVPTAGANLLRVLVIRSAGPVFMTLTNYQVPLWSVFFGIVLLGEPFRASLLLALCLILSGLFISQWGALRRLFGKA